VIGVAEERDPRQALAIDVSAPVDDTIFDLERAAFVRDRQADDERADQVRRVRRVLVTHEVTAGRVHQDVRERCSEVHARRQRGLDLVQHLVEVEAADSRASACTCSNRVPHVRVEQGFATLTEGRELAVLDNPVDEAWIVERRDTALREHDRSRRARRCPRTSSARRVLRVRSAAPPWPVSMTANRELSTVTESWRRSSAHLPPRAAPR
jgi:hypothetical protein